MTDNIDKVADTEQRSSDMASSRSISRDRDDREGASSALSLNEGDVSVTASQYFHTINQDTESNPHKRALFSRRKACFIVTALLLLALIALIVGASCGTGHCGGSSSSAAAASQDAQTTPTAPSIVPTAAPTVEPTNGPPTTFQDLFGDNVKVIDSTWTTSGIQNYFDTLFLQQVNNEMGTERYAVFFKPGIYGSTTEPLMLQIGYYTELAGLGALPDDVQINGKIEVYNRCFEPTQYALGKFIPSSAESGGVCFALNNFWRSLANLRINIVSLNQEACRATAMFWAVSQASSTRRMHFTGGDISLMDYCSSKFL